jgi:hypothetical protein
MSIQNELDNIHNAYGRDTVEATAVWSSLMITHGTLLAIACGVPEHRAIDLRAHEIRALYSMAKLGEAQAKALCVKQGWMHAGAVPTALPTPTPTVAHNPELANRVKELELAKLDTEDALKSALGRINELETKAPKVLEITVADLPKVSFTHAHQTLPRVMRYAANRKHIWLCGPRGSGKSTAAAQVAKALNLSCHVMTGATDGTDFTGYIQLHDGSLKRTPFRDAWEHGGVIVLDEFDSYDPAAILVINDAMSNGKCTFPDGSITKHPDCIVIAGTNTDGTGASAEYSARSVLDSSTRDRFAFIPWGYDLTLETALGAVNPSWTKYVQAVRVAMTDLAMPDAPSPRATINGAQAIQFGDTWEEAAEAYIFKGMKPDQIRRINNAVTMENYSASNCAA